MISEVSLVYKTIYYHTKFYQVKNYMFPNWILQEFLSWPFFPVLLGGDHLYHVSKTMKWEQSQHRAHERTSLISFLWTAYCHFPLKNINILKNFLGYASLLLFGWLYPKSKKDKKEDSSNSAVLEDSFFLYEHTFNGRS